MQISKSVVDLFYHDHWPNVKDKGQRLGQAFHNYCKLHMITNPHDKLFCDQLWNMDGWEARKAIESITDRNN